MNFIITVPADGLAPNGARPSVGTILAAKFDMADEISENLAVLQLMLETEYSSFGGQCYTCWCTGSKVASASTGMVLAV